METDETVNALGGSGRCDNRLTAQHLPRDPVRPSSGL